MPFKEMKFKGKRVFVEVDDEGKVVVQKGRAKMKYKLDDDREYGPGISNLTDTEGNPIELSGLQATPTLPPKIKPPVSLKKRTPKGKSTASSDAIIAYTDGACSGNPGPAGLGYSIVFPDGRRVEKGEPLGQGTNNIAELTAIMRVLEIVEDTSAKLIIHTDSEYSIGVLTRGWKAKANIELIAQIKLKLRRFSNIEFIKVKGHAGVPENELVDELARNSSETQTVVEG